MLTLINTPAAWTPFVNPIYSAVPHLTQWWLLLVLPLILIISLVYKTVRSPDGHGILWPTLWFGTKVLVSMAAISIVLQLLYHYVTRLSGTQL